MVDNWNIEIICYGLRINWKGEFFTGSEELFKIADYLYPIENYCKHEKGKLAYFHVKLSGSDSDVELGYENMYDTVSRKYWLENKMKAYIRLRCKVQLHFSNAQILLQSCLRL